MNTDLPCVCVALCNLSTLRCATFLCICCSLYLLPLFVVVLYCLVELLITSVIL